MTEISGRMSTITKTALNSPAVQKFYENQLTAGAQGSKKMRGGNQEGAGLVTDLISGLVTNVSRAAVAGRRLARARKTKPPKRKAKQPATSQHSAAKTTRQRQPQIKRGRQPIKGRGQRSHTITSQNGKGPGRPRKSATTNSKRQRIKRVII